MKFYPFCLVTYLGVAFSLLGLNVAFDKQIPLAMIFLVIAGICDLFDGTFARRFHRSPQEKSFGVQMDSLADMINFIALPIGIFAGMGLDTWYGVGIFVFYALCGITRLAYFNVHAEVSPGPMAHYTGLPVTYAALIFPIGYLSSSLLGEEFFSAVYLIIILAIAMLFICPVKIKKPSGKQSLFFAFLAIVVSVLLWRMR